VRPAKKFRGIPDPVHGVLTGLALPIRDSDRQIDGHNGVVGKHGFDLDDIVDFDVPSGADRDVGLGKRDLAA
jgi:hypothetical protein